MLNHEAIFLPNNANKRQIIQDILSKNSDLKGLLFSKITIDELLVEEDRYGFTELTKSQNRSLRSMSSGEQKQALLKYLFAQKIDFIILDNPFDNLDDNARKTLNNLLFHMKNDVLFVQIVHRNRDLLTFIEITEQFDNQNVISQPNNQSIRKIPQSIIKYEYQNVELISFKNVNVSYNEKQILRDISWTISRGEFWHLIGPNGSGKTTILSMITGDNPKGYGQNLTLFGKKKGTGESVWEIKDKIGYVTPAMTDLFSSRHTLEQMIISGFYDSIGLYITPTDFQKRIAKEWLSLIKMEHLATTLFCLLSAGHQRFALVVRAMIKHPPLLILDEAIAGLDDRNTLLVVSLINKFASESESTILYVSHRVEEGLNPRHVYELIPSEAGSIGKIKTTT